MSTSEHMLVAEAAGSSIVVTGAVALAAPHDVWLPSFGFHPAWLIIIVMAARYGPRGLFLSLGFSFAALTTASLALGGSLDGFVMRTESGADLLAVMAAVMVAWIAMLHQSRMERSQARLGEVVEAQRRTEQTVRALHDNLSYLRARHDRLDVSLSLWRNLAGRIERGDTPEASKAVLELCEIRTGAMAGIVQLRDGNRLGTVGWRGQWSASAARPRDIAVDGTVRAAIMSRRVSPAGTGATETDSDVAVPVLDEGGEIVIGVIALRGVAPGSLRAADLADLAVIAQWLAPALARSLQAAALRKKTGEQRKRTGERLL